MAEKKSAHRKALERIALNPNTFGVCNVISCAIEKNLYHRGNTLAQPDVIFECSNGEIYIFEYKGNGNEALRERAQKQLERAVFWYAKYQDIEPDKIHTKIVSGTDPQFREVFK